MPKKQSTSKVSTLAAKVLSGQKTPTIEEAKARFSEVGWAADNVFLAPIAAVGGRKSAQLSCALAQERRDGTEGMRLGGQPDRLD
jgi:hypothetical protein